MHSNLEHDARSRLRRDPNRRHLSQPAPSSRVEGTESVILSDDRHPTWKRALDGIIILLLLPVLVLLIPILALWIRVVGRGPVFFRQERVGYRGSVFTMYKFRSMAKNAPCCSHERHVRNLVETGRPLTKLDCLGDERLIPGGAFLRKTGLDELPQLLNVLRGEMSWVGPRPCVPAELELFSTSERERFETLPGLSGLWQVSGKNRTTFAEMVALDVHYVRNKSLWLDLAVLLRTPAAIVTQFLGNNAAQAEPPGSPAPKPRSSPSATTETANHRPTKG